MRYKLFGRSGLRVSELALGTMTFGPDWGWGADKDVSRAMFDAFAEAGGNLIDTANRDTNGTAEQYVGEFVAKERERFVVATKYTLSRHDGDANASGNHRKSLVESLEISLRRLRTDYVDIYRAHRSAWARSPTSASPTPRHGSSPGPTPWPSCGGGRRSAGCRAGTAWSSATPSGSCCR